MKKVVLFVLFTLVCNIVFASTIPTNLPEYKIIIPTRTDKDKSISDSAKFYLVTCAPGAAVYERFGHSGIRVHDSVKGIDEVFHWGLFSFDTPNFIGRFIAGNTDYEMGVYTTKFFMLQYIERGSSVYAQELDLTTEQKHELYTKLWNNYRPENRKYRYNFIFDNCATRPYQLIISTYNYKISTNTQQEQITYRDIINKYVPIGSPLNTGINLIIGSRADKLITTKESVSFPMYTMSALNHTQYITHDGSTKPIVLTQSEMHHAPHKNFQTSNLAFYSWIIIPLILTFICITYTHKKRRYLPYLSQIILFVSGLIGIIICYLWFFSHHPLVNDNMNLLWCSPLNIILAILLFIHKKPVVRTIKVALSALSLISCIAFLIILITDMQTSTPQIFSIWALVVVINATIIYTYRYKFKKLRYKK